MADWQVDLYTAVVGYQGRGGLSGASGWPLISFGDPRWL